MTRPGTFYNVDGTPMTYEEVMNHIIQTWKTDREAARLLVYEHGISWYALAQWQREDHQYQEASKVVKHRES